MAHQSGGFPESYKISEQQRGKNGDSDCDPPIPSLRFVKLYYIFKHDAGLEFNNLKG